MDDKEFDQLINEKVTELIDLVEERYSDQPVTKRMAVLVDVVIAKHRVTWFGAYDALSKVIRKYGYLASVQCGEIKDAETADLFHQDGQAVVGDNQADGEGGTK